MESDIPNGNILSMDLGDGRIYECPIETIRDDIDPNGGDIVNYFHYDGAFFSNSIPDQKE